MQFDPGSALCSADRSKSLSVYCQLGRRWGVGADYRVCERCGGSGDRIPEGRSGVWNRLQNFYDCRTGNFIWDIQQLGVRVDLLDIKNTGSGVSHSLLYETLQILVTEQTLDFAAGNLAVEVGEVYIGAGAEVQDGNPLSNPIKAISIREFII